MSRPHPPPPASRGAVDATMLMALGGVSLTAMACVAVGLARGLTAVDVLSATVIGAMMLAPLLLRRLGLSQRRSTLVFLFVGSAAALVASSVQGGLSAIALAWLPVGPLAAALIGSTGGALGLVIFDLLAVAVLFFVEVGGLLPPALPSSPAHGFVNMGGLLASTTVGALLYLRGQRQAEERVAASRRSFRTLAEEMPHGAVVRVAGRVIYANRAARELLALPADLEGQALPGWLPDMEASPAEEVAEVTVPLPGGDARWVELHERPIEAFGEVGRLLTVVDVTARKEMERQRIRTEAQLQRAMRLEQLGLLAGGLAHDLNNTLSAVLTNAVLLEEELLVEDTRAMASDIRVAAQQAGDQVRQLLAYAGRGNVVRRPADLGEVAQATARVHRAEARAAEVRLCLDGCEPGTDFISDPVQVSQVVGNLVSNALRACEPGGEVGVRTSRRVLGAGELAEAAVGRGEPGEYVVLTVHDTGSGITTDDLGRIFDPYFTTRTQGRGLGLAAVHGIVNRLGGVLFVQSTVGEGTTFRVAFPATPPAEARSDGGTLLPVQPAAPPAVAVGGRRRILVLDDEPLIRKQISRVLARGGFEALPAATLDDALLIQAEGGLDGAVIDFLMPRVTGDVALERLRRQDPHLPAVLCSGYIGDQDVDVTRGFQLVLHKPFSPGQLVDALHRVARPASPTAVASR